MLQTLGGLKVEGNTFKRPKPLLMLAYLALEGGQSRRHLAELFWPDTTDSMTRLRTLLTQLRQGIPDCLESDEQLRLTLSCDAQALLKAAERGDVAQLSTLYRGAFLAGFHLPNLGVELEEWLYTTREFLAERAREGWLRAAETQLAQGEPDEAARLAAEAQRRTRAAEADPETLTRLYRLLRAGDHPAARDIRREAASFGLELPDKDPDYPAQHPETPPAIVPNPPSRPGALGGGYATSFVGRDLELVEVMSLLAQEGCRLVTLLGPGGVGKTRLALKVVQEQAGAFPDGVHIVWLETLTDPALILAAIAEVLGLKLSGQRDLLAALDSVLQPKRVLLLLDNLEQVVAGVGVLAELLGRCAHLKLLVTSRERLGLTEEWVFPVEGLPVPDGLSDPGEAARLDVFKLFVQRAKRVRLDFTLDRETLPHVSRICQRVGGVPLAIELAAAWVRAASALTLAREIEDNLDLLVSTERHVSQRQSSLRATFEYSWVLLSPKEQALFSTLSVFTGGFTREAASRVAGATIPMLASLVDKSLLRLLPNGRYDSHPLLHHYARGKLTGQRFDQAQAAHGDYFAQLIKTTERMFCQPEQRSWLARIRAEVSNVRSALAWFEQHDPPTALHLISAVDYVYLVQGFGSELLAMLRRLLEPVPDAPAELLGRAYNSLGFLQANLGVPAEAEKAYRQSLTIARAIGEPFREARVLRELGELVRERRDHETALTLLHESLACAGQSGDSWNAAWTLLQLGVTLRVTNHWQQARDYAAQSLTHMTQLGDNRGVALALNDLGVAALRLGNDAAAQDYFERCLATEHTLGDSWAAAYALTHLGDLAAKQGNTKQAQQHYQEALTIKRQLGQWRQVAQVLLRLESLAEQSKEAEQERFHPHDARGQR